jgi:hypothetical protein
MPALNGRREAIYVALAAAQVCWLAPLFLTVTGRTIPHPPLLLWASLLVLYLGLFYTYRLLLRANLPILHLQIAMTLALLLSMALAFRVHVYASAGLQGIAWALEPFRRLADISETITGELVTIFTLLLVWLQSIRLARRSVSPESVGFSFRAGILILVWGALAARFLGDIDVSGFVAPYFFFGLLAAALARVEGISLIPGSVRARGSAFWIVSAVVAVVLVVLLSSLVAFFFVGGALERLLVFLSPVLVVVQAALVAIALLIFGLLELLLSLFRGRFDSVRRWLDEAMREIGASEMPLPPVQTQDAAAETFWGAMQLSTILIIVGVIVALVLLITWWRVLQDRDAEGTESRESLLSARAVTRNLLDALRAGRDRLGDMAGLVDRFGLGTRLLSAISIQRIYANLVRVATRAGHPRVTAKTPYEYLGVLEEAWPAVADELTIITDAYVSAHYGQVPDTREELERIRVAWERVQAHATRG